MTTMDGSASHEQEVPEELTPGELRALMRERAQRRKSPWNVLLFLLGLGGVAATWYGFLWIVVGARNLVLGEHVASVTELVRSRCEGFAAGVCFVCSFFAAIPFGGFVANGILRCVAPIRRVFDEESGGVPGASFGESQRGLLLFALYVSLPALLLALGGGLLMRCRCG